MTVIQPELLWPRRAAFLAGGLLLVTHPLSLANLLVEVRPSLMIALLMSLVLVGFAPRFLAELTRPAALPVVLLLAWQTALLLGHSLRWSWVSYWATPALALNALSYLLVPQVCCLLLGLAAGRDREAADRLLRIILISNVVALVIGILFYLTRPGFVLAAEVRVFGENTDKYMGFLPRMHGYFNSMVLGALCYTALGLAVLRVTRPSRLLALIVLCSLAAALTMQRASWLITGGMAAVCLAVLAARGAASWWRPQRLFALVAVAGLIAAGGFAIYRFALEQPWFAIAAEEFDNRVRYFGTSVAERSDQWVVSLAFVREEPIGVGLGVVSHKAAEIEGLRPYAVTDGNWFRILAETGLPGLALFTLLVLSSLAGALRQRRLTIAGTIALILVGAVGSNLFDLYYIGFVFWLLVGIGCAGGTMRRQPLPDIS